MDAAASRPPFGDPTLRLVGHYDGTPPQLEALRIERSDPRGRAPAGMDMALLAYSGISVKMLVDRTFGADHVTMFTVDYEIGGAAQAHDHPFEEAYVFLAGEVECELDGEHYTFRPATSCSPASGRSTGSTTTGTERVRWIETQAPQPPARHAYRWVTELGAVRPKGASRIGGNRWLTKPRSSSSAARERSGRRSPATTPSAGATVVLTGRDPANVAAAVAAVGGQHDGRHLRPGRAEVDRGRPRRRRAGPPPRRSPPSIATRTPSPTTTSTRAIRLVTLKLVGYTEVVHTLRDRLTDGRLDRAVRRHGQGAAVPGLHDRHDRQRRCRRPDPDARRGAQADPRQLHPPGDRRRQPVLGGEGRGGRSSTTSETPIGRLATMDRDRRRRVFLLENTAVNGVELIVDGGWHCR